MIGDVAAVDEVGPQQRLLQRPLDRRAVLALSERQEAVGVACVRPLSAFEVEVEPVGGGDLGDVGDDLLRPLLAAELARVRLHHGHRGAGGRRRVELERAEHEFHVLAPLEPGQRLFEPALADVAPRTHHVGPDLDSHHLPR